VSQQEAGFAASSAALLATCVYSIITGAALAPDKKVAAVKPPVVTRPHSQAVRSLLALTDLCRLAGLLVAEVSVNSMCELGQARPSPSWQA